MAPHGIVESRRQRELDPTAWISLERGPMGQTWGIHCEKCPPFPTSPLALSLCSFLPLGQIFFLSSAEEHFPCETPRCFMISLAENSHVHIWPRLHHPLGDGGKETHQILIGLNHLTRRRRLSREDRGKPGLLSSKWVGPLHSQPHCPTPHAKLQRLDGNLEMMFKRGREEKTHLGTYPICLQTPFFEHTMNVLLQYSKPDEMHVINLWRWQDYYG